MLLTQTYRITPEQRAFIDELFARHKGEVTNDLIVRAAKPADSPIHDLFIWDDKRAAQLHRLRTAGRIMRSYTGWTVSSESSMGESIPADATPIAVKVRKTPEADPAWIKTGIALADEYMRTQLIEKRLASVRSSMRQLLVVPELRRLHEQLEEAITRYKIEPTETKKSQRRMR